MELLTRLIINKLKNEKGGVTPTGTINITTNGEHNVTDYATANVNVTSTNNAKMSGEYIAGIEAVLKTIVIEVDNVTLSSTVKHTSNLFNGCTYLRKAPTINTGNVISMNYMYMNCTSLEDVPVYDTTNTEAMKQTFTGCSSLTNASLNNILTMCTNSAIASGSKTLSYIGLTSDQATICTGLSNWAACLSAGWSTGY